MQNSLQKNHRLLFYAGWLLINIVQAATTELMDDEAYYWMYSRFLDWGYFDHPPMVAALIKAGYFIFHNELGVRFAMVLLNTATIFIIQQLTKNKDDRLFYAVAGSVGVAQIGGILAAPDIPLLFFVALFFWMYQRFVQQMNFVNALLLGCCMACLLYSKYHGVLVIVFTLLSNLRLFTRPYLYMAIAVGVICFFPHLYWQYSHDFPSLQYHLFERNAPEYQFSFTTEYLLGQIAFAGPLMGWFLIITAFRHQPVSPYERALTFSLLGTYAFFLLSTAKGRVEPNWTVAAFIPMMVLSHQYLVKNNRWQQWLYKSIPITLLLVLLFRIYMMWWFPAYPWIKGNEIHGNRVWTSEIKQKAGALPVVFTDSYQSASKYWFYTGSTAFSMNSLYYRRNNFNLWPVEDSLIGKPVYLHAPLINKYHDSLFRTYGWTFPQRGIKEDYFSFSRVLFCNVSTSMQKRTLQLYSKICIPPFYQSLFVQPRYSQTPLWLVLYRDGDVKKFINTGATVADLVPKADAFQLNTAIPDSIPAGNYTVRLCLGSCIQGFPTINSTEIAIKVL